MIVPIKEGNHSNKGKPGAIMGLSESLLQVADRWHL
jgi:hypothetical protein